MANGPKELNPETPLVLYVDDEKPNRVVFEQTFRKEFRLVCCGGGKEALEIMASRDVAVLVTDQRMPEMSGNELLAVAKERHPDTVRVIVTAFSDVEPILGAVNQGLVARYIVKPWDREKLATILRWACETYTVGRANSVVQKRLLENERLATLGGICASLVHEMTQPLSLLSHNADYLASLAGDLAKADLFRSELTVEDLNYFSALATEMPKITEEQVAACRVLSDLVRSTMKLANGTAALHDLDCDPVAAIRFAMAVCKASANQTNFEYRGPTDLPKIRMAETEASQVFINIFRNAAQAVGETGRPGKVFVDAAVSETVNITVEDNGCGMNPEVLKQVTKSFFTTKTDGTGLGLHQCRRLVEGKGGTFVIESEKGAWTRVRLGLPISS